MPVIRRVELGALVGLVLLGCPTPVPTLPQAGDDPSTTGAASTTGTTTTGPSQSSSSSTSAAGTTTGTSVDDTGSSSTGEVVPPACEPPQAACREQCVAWWDPAWTLRQAVSVQLPAAPPLGTLTDVVVPVRLGEDFAAGCAEPTAGEDLRFVDEAGTVLPHELDQWSVFGGTVAWVRVPALVDGDAAFWVYYGNPEAPAPEPAEVWPAAELGYEAVLHLGEDLDDSTLGVHHGHKHDAEAPDLLHTDGVLGDALHFEPLQESARVELDDSISIDQAMQGSDQLTVSSWVRVTPNVFGTTGWKSIVGRGDDHWGLTVWDQDCDFGSGGVIVRFLTDCMQCGLMCYRENPMDPYQQCPQCPCQGPCPGFETVDIPSTYPDFPDCPELPTCPRVHYDNHWINGSTSLVIDEIQSEWFHLAAVYAVCDPMTNPACECSPAQQMITCQVGTQVYEKRVYVDGEPDADIKCGCFPMTIVPGTAPITLGTSPNTPAMSRFHGEIDEIHLSSRAWSSERIRAEYELTRPDRRPVALGAVESCTARCQ